ncbi:MAG TPA: phosphoribosyltransferase family protein [Fredinandcohnia sp.]|nr:phosphoribosyltransferase family protein [Fredinandcohnia sp.]
MFRKRAKKGMKEELSPVPVENGADDGIGDRSAAPSRGFRELVAGELDAVCRELAQRVVRSFEPDFIVGIVKGGVFAGEELAAILGCPFAAVRLHARSRDREGALAAASAMPAEVAGKRVLVVDDIPGTGESLLVAVLAAKKAGAIEVRTATLIARSGGYQPDFAALETEDLVVFPWDYEPTTGAVGSAGDDSQI